MRTPKELLAEGECDEMALGELAVLDEVRERLVRAVMRLDRRTSRPYASGEMLQTLFETIDGYAEEIYSEFDEDEDEDD